MGILTDYPSSHYGSQRGLQIRGTGESPYNNGGSQLNHYRTITINSMDDLHGFYDNEVRHIGMICDVNKFQNFISKIRNSILDSNAVSNGGHLHESILFQYSRADYLEANYVAGIDPYKEESNKQLNKTNKKLLLL